MMNNISNIKQLNYDAEYGNAVLNFRLDTLISNIIESSNDDLIHKTKVIKTNINSVMFVKAFRKAFASEYPDVLLKIAEYVSGSILMEFYYKDRPIVYLVLYIVERYMNDDVSQIEITYHAGGNHEKIIEWVAKFTEVELHIEKNHSVIWAYNNGGRISTKHMTIDNPNIIYDEYYPYIKGGVSKFYDDFIKSSSNIFIALGPPGTGKSSFIRNMVVEKKLSVYLTYDDSMLESDSFFIEFLTNSAIDTLIIEDADLLMSKREHDGNKIMRKLLNISDGIVKVMNKKMIFSANITDPSNIDTALMRPGRCFALIDFRTLTKKEAEIAAEKAKIELTADKSEYSLAEIFSQNNVVKKRFGFV